MPKDEKPPIKISKYRKYGEISYIYLACWFETFNRTAVKLSMRERFSSKMVLLCWCSESRFLVCVFYGSSIFQPCLSPVRVVMIEMDNTHNGPVNGTRERDLIRLRITFCLFVEPKTFLPKLSREQKLTTGIRAAKAADRSWTETERTRRK